MATAEELPVLFVDDFLVVEGFRVNSPSIEENWDWIVLIHLINNPHWGLNLSYWSLLLCLQFLYLLFLINQSLLLLLNLLFH
jgi:hypothetical protein